MSTIFKRVYAYAKNNKVPLLSQKERIAVGKDIAEAYHCSEIKKPIFRVKSQENEGVFNVLSYPLEFIKEMDAIISIAYKNRNIIIANPPEPVLEKKKRRRIPVGKKEYSASPVKQVL